MDETRLDAVRHRRELDRWIDDCRRRMALRFPGIDYDADTWPIRTLHQSEQADWHFPPQISDFAEKDRSFSEVIRCLVAEMVISEKPKILHQPIRAFRRLALTGCHTIFDLTWPAIKVVEEDGLVFCRENPFAACRLRTQLTTLSNQLNLMADKGVIPRIGYYIRADLHRELLQLDRAYQAKKDRSSDLLDRKIEALNEALNALLNNDPRLTALDQVAISAMMRKLCAPSRINEVLCSSIDDVVTVNDYAQLPIGAEDSLHNAHKMLLVTMKGSKGAQWSAKPVLNFMIEAFNFTEAIIKKYGARSRMLVEWYQAHPEQLYLPLEFEHLRGNAISRSSLSNIMYFKHTVRNGTEAAVWNIYNALRSVIFKAPNPVSITLSGKLNARCAIDFLPWKDVEDFLLRRVHDAMDACRKVTHENHYHGDLSKMLFLFDRDDVPYLPYAVNFSLIRGRLKRPAANYDVECKERRAPTLFENLGITMPVNGRVQHAEMDTHDPRRWLTTMALRHGEGLSDVLINKWANRSSLAQLKAYDFRSEEERATFSRMPDSAELKDLSGGLISVNRLEEEFGLRTNIVLVQDAAISVTSVQRILDAVEDRPIARTSEQIIIVYPTPYGACLHQHHETPCRRYKRCLTCNENICVKGHVPTNEEIRKVEEMLVSSVVRQLDTLISTYNRGIADCPDLFEEHLETLVAQGLCPHQMADHLIAEFHEIKNKIKNKLLRGRLEEAFVARGYVRLLSNDNIAQGALMKYHNPTQHAAPGLEIALEAHGGRAQVAKEESSLVDKFPIFAPSALGLQDERQRLEVEDDWENE